MFWKIKPWLDLGASIQILTCRVDFPSPILLFVVVQDGISLKELGMSAMSEGKNETKW